jgi:hypothetical protein
MRSLSLGDTRDYPVWSIVPNQPSLTHILGAGLTNPTLGRSPVREHPVREHPVREHPVRRRDGVRRHE